MGVRVLGGCVVLGRWVVGRGLLVLVCLGLVGGVVVGVPLGVGAQVVGVDCVVGGVDGSFLNIDSDGADLWSVTLERDHGLVLPVVEDPWVWRVTLCLPLVDGVDPVVVDGPDRVLSSEVERWEREALEDAVGGIDVGEDLVRPGPWIRPPIGALQVVNHESWLAVDPLVFSRDERVVEVVGESHGVVVEVVGEPVASLFSFSDGVVVRCEGNVVYDPVLLPPPCGRSWDRPTLGDDVVEMEVRAVYGLEWVSSVGGVELGSGVEELEGDPIREYRLQVGEIQTFLSEEVVPAPGAVVVEEIPSRWPGDGDGCDDGSWLGWLNVDCVRAQLDAFTDAVETFLVAEIVAKLPEALREAATMVFGFARGCAQFFSDAVSEVIARFQDVIAFLRNPVQFVNEKVKLAETMFEAFEEDRTGFMNAMALAFVDDEAESWGDVSSEAAVTLAGSLVCEIGIGIITGGAAAARTVNKLIDLVNQKLPDGVDFPHIKDKDKDDDKGDDGDDGDGDNCKVGQAGCGCNSFPAGTLVLLASGAYRPIEMIDPGERVVTYDTGAGVWSDRVVLAQWSGVHDGQMATIHLDDGSVTSTGGHEFWVNNLGEWVEADQLQPGDLLLGPDGVTKVESVTLTHGADSIVWELDTAVDNNFIVGGLTETGGALAHNECYDDLSPEVRKAVDDLAAELAVDPRYLADLASDPSNKGRIDAKSLREAEVALKARGVGNKSVLRIPADAYLPGPLRSPDTELGDIVDGSGDYWDVKQFDPSQPGNSIDDIVEAIKAEHDLGEDILVDTVNMSEDFILELGSRLELEDLTGRVVILIES